MIYNSFMNKAIIDESELVTRLKRGDESAYSALVRQYEKKIFRIAFGITRDREESEDIVQETFLKVYRKIGSFRESSSLNTWIHRIAVNESLNLVRKWKRRFRKSHESINGENDGHRNLPADDEGKPDNLYSRKELSKKLDEEMRKLPDQARAVLVLKEIEGMSYEEIAKILKIKKGTVSSRLFYARKKLMASMGDYLGRGN